MLSYQHVYHAGNNADCHKHSLQAWLLDFLRKDKSPFIYIDTHAGRGLYHFSAEEIQKLNEYQDGIIRLWENKTWPREAAAYKNVVTSLNRDGIIKHYPGSPWVAEALRRPQDPMVLFELHPREYEQLQKNMGRLSTLNIHLRSGWSLMQENSTIPRGMVAVDPSYELKEEYELMKDRINSIATRFPGFIISLWYPILAEPRHAEMVAALEQLELPYYKSEMSFNNDKAMTGSGLFVINPPANFAAAEKSITDWLKQLL